MLSTKLKEAAGNSADATLYVDDVFSTYLYTGNNSTQTITNGIDLAGKGGMVWTKVRSTIDDHELIDTVRGRSFSVESNTTDAQSASSVGTSLTQFNSNGYSLGTNGNANVNENAQTFVSWTFRKAAKFFDVVTWTGDGATNRAIPHSLGIQPGFLVCKRTDTTGGWPSAHRRSGTQGFYGMELNTTGLGYDWPDYNTYITSTTFDPTQLAGGMNISGGTYVAYLFAHDTSSTGIIQCGSSSTNSSGNDIVDLGFEPQWVMIKPIGSAGGNWEIRDIMRGFPHTNSGASLYPNLSSAEVSSGGFYMSDSIGGTNGFQLVGKFTSQAYIYMAIRRPNKPPTSGTQLFSADIWTQTGGL